MTNALALVRLLPLPFLGRLGIACVEIVLATIVVSGSVVLGHDLKAWRAWYWDPSTLRYWQPTPSPTPLASAAPVPTVVYVARPATPATTPACRGATGGEQLVFAHSGGQLGLQCVWFTSRSDGTHLLVASNAFATTDLGVISDQLGAAIVRPFAPASWSEPVLVVTGARANGSNVLVVTWQTRGLLELLRADGERIDVASDAGGWPRIGVQTGTGMHMYRWSGSSFAQYP